MEEAKAVTPQQQQQQFLQQQQQQQQQQQFLLLQQLQKQAQQQHQQQQQAAISRFPSNIDAHLRTPGVLQHRRINIQQKPNPTPILICSSKTLISSKGNRHSILNRHLSNSSNRSPFDP
ncbi:hypothetical protein SLA2020_056370 [Shorea laevis]